MKDRELLLKIKKLADAMYNAYLTLSTDASRVRKAMDDYKHFIIYEYREEEPAHHAEADIFSDKEKIKAELERRMYDDYNSGEAEVDCVAQGVCASMIQFIDSMQEEPSEDLEEEIRKYFLAYKGYPHIMDKTEREMKKACIHFANWQKKKILKESEDAIQYVKENHSPSEVSDFQNAMNIAVMKAFDAGKEKMREQMMKDVVECPIEATIGYDGLARIKGNYKYGDTVKLVIIKNNGKEV